MHGLYWWMLLLFLDNIMIIAPDFDSHLHQLDVFYWLKEVGLKPPRCKLCQSQARYLDHVVSENGVATKPGQQGGLEMADPTRTREWQGFFSMFGCYHQYMLSFATMAWSLQKLTEKRKKWRWREEDQAASDALKECISSAPILAYPNPSHLHILDMDAGECGVCASTVRCPRKNRKGDCLLQQDQLCICEKNYCIKRKELLAVVKAAKPFRLYLYVGNFCFKLMCFTWLAVQVKETGQPGKTWYEILIEFQNMLKHWLGFRHRNPDRLSRQTCEDCLHCERIKLKDGRIIRNLLWKVSPCHASLRKTQQQCQGCPEPYTGQPVT